MLLAITSLIPELYTALREADILRIRHIQKVIPPTAIGIDITAAAIITARVTVGNLLL